MSAAPTSFALQGPRLLLTDAAMAILAPGLALTIRGMEWSSAAILAHSPYWVLGAAFSLAFLIHFRLGRILPHFLSRRDVTQILKLAALAAAFTAAAALFFGRPELIPFSLPIIHFAVLVALLAGWRALAGAHARRRQGAALLARRAPRVSTLIVGVGPAASLFIRLLKSMKDVRLHIVGLLDDDRRLHGRSVDGHVILGGVDRFEAVVMELASHGVELQRVFIAHLDPEAEKAAREALQDACAQRGIQLEAISDRLCLPFFGRADDERVNSTYGLSKTRAQKYLALRRYLDFALALAGLIVLIPLIALVAIVIRVQLGAPVTFWQQRVGLHGDPIVVNKFRTLSPAVDANGRMLSLEERESALGRFLRAVRLDELPQLYDVVRGRMNLIGPRPLLPVDLANDCSVRQSVVPGLTGWAQVHGGKEISVEEKNALDEWYVYHASPSLDLKIIWSTIRIVVSGDRRKDDAIVQAMSFRAKRLSEAGVSDNTSEVSGARKNLQADESVQFVEEARALHCEPAANKRRLASSAM
jgi:lipopolysaccharide/colanic/teichoic acid biosynthesis glycosyltransferase